MKALVSIVIPVYNRQNTIARAIDSVLAQSYQNIEILVVDDGSSDKTREILQSYDDKRVRIFYQEHMGASAARNKGVEEAKGEYVAFQDSDDEWMPDKLYEQVDYMRRNYLKVCFCPYELHNGNTTTIVPFEYLNRYKYENGIYEILKYTNVIGTPCLIAEKKIFSEIGKFDVEMPGLEDYELVIRIVQKYKIGYCPKILVKAYRQENSISGKEEWHREAICQLIRKHRDYIDCKSLITGLYDEVSFFEHKEIEWDYLAYLEKISCLGKEFNELTLNYLHRKYIAVGTLLDFMQKQQWNKFENQLRSDEFIIYGAGVYARKIASRLRKKGLKPKCFLVTQLEGGKQYIDGIIVDILKEKYRHMPILIGTNFENQIEICRILDKEHFDNYCAYPVYDLQ